jgi:periplasmic protein TonB
MKKFIGAICFCCVLNAVSAQTDSIDYNSEVKEVQIEPTFPGGTMVWKKYLERNQNLSLGKEFIKLKDNEAFAQQTVILSFLVHKDGMISDIIVENEKEVHPKLAEEAIRLIKRGPRWVPGLLNGRPVIYRQRQSITWIVQK